MVKSRLDGAVSMDSKVEERKRFTLARLLRPVRANPVVAGLVAVAVVGLGAVAGVTAAAHAASRSRATGAWHLAFSKLPAPISDHLAPTFRPTVACLSLTHCYGDVISSQGDAIYDLHLTGSTWTASVAYSPGHEPFEARCPIVGYCYGYDNNGVSEWTERTGWTLAPDVNGLVGCDPDLDCMEVITPTGDVEKIHDGHWVPTNVTVIARFPEPSCPAVNDCWIPGGLTDQSHLTHLSGRVTDVTAVSSSGVTTWIGLSCVNARTCLAEADNGTYYRYDGNSWQPDNQALDGIGRAHPTHFDCALGGDCWVVGDKAGYPGLPTVRRFDGTTWSTMELPALPYTFVITASSAGTAGTEPSIFVHCAQQHICTMFGAGVTTDGTTGAFAYIYYDGW